MAHLFKTHLRDATGGFNGPPIEQVVIGTDPRPASSFVETGWGICFFPLDHPESTRWVSAASVFRVFGSFQIDPDIKIVVGTWCKRTQCDAPDHFGAGVPLSS